MYEYSNIRQKGFSQPISTQDANDTEYLISQGILKGNHMKNVIQLGNTLEMKAMIKSIKDDGKGGSTTNNNREYSGYFITNGVKNNNLALLAILFLHKFFPRMEIHNSIVTQVEI